MSKSINNDQKIAGSQELKVKKRLTKPIIAVILSAIILLCFGLGFLTSYLVMESPKSKLEQLIDTIEEQGIFLNKTYYGENISEDQMLANAVSGILAQDKYAKYYTASEYSTYVNQSGGSYYGIGVTFEPSSTSSKTTTTVLSVMGNSPAEIAGIRKNDKILGGKTATESYQSFSYSSDFESFFSQLENNQEFTLTVKKSPSGQEIEVTLIKRAYQASYIKYYDNTQTLNFVTESGSKYSIYQGNPVTQLDDSTAMIKIDRFYGDMVNQFKNATDYMKNNGKTKLILDLRANGGGSVNTMLALCQYLIYNRGNTFSPIMYAIDKNGDSKAYTTALNLYLGWIEDLVVLADANTASASECLINAMLYYGNIDGNFSQEKLVIVNNNAGQAKTFGKGIMQKYFTFEDGSALKLTTSFLYAPDKTTCIHGTGITTTAQNGVASGKVIERAVQILANA